MTEHTLKYDSCKLFRKYKEVIRKNLTGCYESVESNGNLQEQAWTDQNRHLKSQYL